MREYARRTRECSFNEFPPEIHAAFRKYSAKHELASLEADILICAETASEKLKQGFFAALFGGANYSVKTCIIVTSERLLWATLDNKNETSVLAARLSEIEIKDFQSNPVEDTGLEVFGLLNEVSERATAFIGLGEDAAAEKLKHMLKTAAQNATRR